MIELETLISFFREHKYLAMFGALVLSAVGLPVPEEVTLLAGGIAVGWEAADLWLALLVCIAGVLVADSLLFAMGRYAGDWFLSTPPLRWLLGEKRRARINGLFDQHGAKAVFFARFVVGARLGVFVYAGQHGMRWTRFLRLDLMGVMVTSPVMMLVGVYVGRQVADPRTAAELARQLAQESRHWLYSALGLLILLWSIHQLSRRWAPRPVAVPAESPQQALARVGHGDEEGNGR